MSMISEQVNYLRNFDCFGTVKQAMNEAADTIEALSAKLAAANMERLERYYNGGWILCEDRLPENFEVVLAFTEENQMVTVARDGNDWVLHDQHIIKEKVIKWQPLPKEPNKE